jgi:hypothetical protein
VPVLVVDVKGDLPNLALAFPSFDVEPMTPWVEPAPGDEDGVADPPVVAEAAEARRRGLAAWQIDEASARAIRREHPRPRDHARARTPASRCTCSPRSSSAQHALGRRDPESARATLAAAVSLILRLIGRDPDPARSREHALLSVLAERRLSAGRTSPLGSLVARRRSSRRSLEIGALPRRWRSWAPKRARELAADLNTLLASPSFARWRKGARSTSRLDEPVEGKTPATIVSVAHLDDDERALVLGVCSRRCWRGCAACRARSALRALIVFDEVYGFLPPHPASPPTKRPLVALMKQARAFGVGCVLATQNPMDLDYRALSNAGTWCLGRLQTDADRAPRPRRPRRGRLKKKGGDNPSRRLLKKLGPPLVRHVRATRGTAMLVYPRLSKSPRAATGSVLYPTSDAAGGPNVGETVMRYGPTAVTRDVDEEHLTLLDELVSRGVDYLEVLDFALGPGSPLLRGRSFADAVVQSSPGYVRARDRVTEYGRSLGLVGSEPSTSTPMVVREELAPYGAPPSRCVSQYRAATLLGWPLDRVRSALASGELAGRVIDGACVVDESALQSLLAS